MSRSYWQFLGWIVAVAASLGVSYYASRMAIDFHVYALTARLFFTHGVPIYGAEGLLQWPMWYRYPPLFLFLFWPYSLPPLAAGAFLWALSKCVVLALLVRALVRRVGQPSRTGLALACFIALPYTVNELRFGNAQMMVFALVGAAFLQFRRRPRLGSLLLGLAASLKLWPFIFVPYLAATRRRLEAVWTVCFAALLSALPALHLGWPEYTLRLERWFAQESEIVAGATAIWFPSQSLLGVMSRYLTDIPYEELPDANYPEINFAALDPDGVYFAWAVLVVLLYGLWLWWAAREIRRQPLAMLGVGFCLLVIVQPYSQRQITLVVLLFPALVAGLAWLKLPRVSRILMVAAAGLAVLPQALPSGQRWLQVLGLDAVVALLVGGALAQLVRQSPIGPPLTAGDQAPMSKALPAEKQDPTLMKEMFHTISPRYDFITRIFSYGMDADWKIRAVERADLPSGARILDLACGTGDFSRLVLDRDRQAQPVSADLTFNMLRLARQGGLPAPVCADAMRLPFPDESFDAVFVGYGLRNFPVLADALTEMRRVLKPGGKLVSLDFFLPRNPIFRPLYLGYLYAQGYLWGLVLHGRPRIYTYIPDSLSSFVSMDGYLDALSQNGYSLVEARGFILSGIALHWAERV